MIFNSNFHVHEKYLLFISQLIYKLLGGKNGLKTTEVMWYSQAYDLNIIFPINSLRNVIHKELFILIVNNLNKY